MASSSNRWADADWGGMCAPLVLAPAPDRVGTLDTDRVCRSRYDVKKWYSRS